MNEQQLRRFKRLRRFIHWLIAVALVVYVVTGFGITEFRTMEAWTLGLMGKATAMQIHNSLEWPFAVLLAIHILVSLVYRTKKKQVSA